MTRIRGNVPINVGFAEVESASRTATDPIDSDHYKDSSVMLDVTPHHNQRDYDLEAALAETRADLAAGRVVQESPEAHLARLESFPTT